MTPRKRAEETVWRVGAGVLEPYDAATAAQFRANGYKRGDLLSGSFKKARNPKFNNLAHGLGSLIAENLEDFDGMKPHAVIKRLQWEANVGCDEFGAKAPGLGLVMIRTPRSLSFASMDEGEFQGVMKGLCRYIAKTYWPTCTPEQVEAMASAWVEAT